MLQLQSCDSQSWLHGRTRASRWRCRESDSWLRRRFWAMGLCVRWRYWTGKRVIFRWLGRTPAESFPCSSSVAWFGSSFWVIFLGGTPAFRGGRACFSAAKVRKKKIQSKISVLKLKRIFYFIVFYIKIHNSKPTAQGRSGEDRRRNGAGDITFCSTHLHKIGYQTDFLRVHITIFSKQTAKNHFFRCSWHFHHKQTYILPTILLTLSILYSLLTCRILIHFRIQFIDFDIHFYNIRGWIQPTWPISHLQT